MAEEQKTHMHVLEDGTVVEHSHGEHVHHHSHAHTKAVLNRMSRAIGHMESIKRMIEDGRDCAEFLIQLSEYPIFYCLSVLISSHAVCGFPAYSTSAQRK